MFSGFNKTHLCLVIVIAVLLTSSHVSRAQSPLPLLPQQITSPYPEPDQRLVFKSAKQLQVEFAELRYFLRDISNNNSVPTIFTTNLPPDLDKQPVDEKISTFIRLMLPNIIAANQQILQVRKTLQEWEDTPLSSLTDVQRRWLKDLCVRYSIDTVDIKKLLQHIDILPVGMVLAQAIEESGWGTGHFAIEGNALYGQHLPESGGNFLVTPNGKVKVAAFDTLYQATAAYIHDINSSHAYQKLRELQYGLKKKNSLNGYTLVTALGHYSTRGQNYVNALQSLITHHQLDSYGDVTFTSKKIVATIGFER